MSELREDLADLLGHAGWHWFAAKVEAEWGAGGSRFETTLDRFADSREEDRVVLEQIRQIAVCRREILRLLKLPQEEVRKLQQGSASLADPLRAALAPELVAQSRRGAL